MREGLNLLLLALKMEKGDHELENVVASGAGKDKDMGSPLEPPERLTDLLTA